MSQDIDVTSLKQVNADHYQFEKYVYLSRWSSYWYQIKEILATRPKSVMEIGVGDMVTGSYLRRNGIEYTAVDVADDIGADVLADVRSLPFDNETFDTACAFEILEHIPFDDFEKGLGELLRVSKRWVLISMPHFGPSVEFWVKIPFFPRFKVACKVPYPIAHVWRERTGHYWEIGKRGYSVSAVKQKIARHGKLHRHYVPFENQYHHFFIIEKMNTEISANTIMSSSSTKGAPWEVFYRERLTNLFNKSKQVIDIGGGLRVIKEKNNRYTPENEWLRPLIEAVDYKILDPVADYHPDIIGDIHKLPFEDNSVESFVCNAVLEHVEDPWLGAKEMYRCLKPGGMCFVYVPFLFYYHPMKGYYGDFFRFTKEGLRHMFRDFSVFEVQSVRGAIETWLKIGPFGRYRWICRFGRFLDRVFGKTNSDQTSGYYVYMVK